ncbi:uncharacterized protein LOC106760884 isoform X2 [Vigna radiata var. radiata]|uniref:Uncharacterized protein LOC106760884 isoform X2 n=1 Tax=Vigna radiata var. radiata TaxID=3916 RepID=A0A1S3U1C4_VIGRR|nr:uncharacterized protein LOC106760884 isoform X2 [Vigna radiata var. radiata]
MHICGYVPPWLCQILACMGSCLGCFPAPPIIKGQGTNKDISEDFWSSSALEIDLRAFQSQKSISSIIIPSDPQSSSGIQIDSPEFVNDGLLLWNQMRRHWVRNKRPQNKKEVREPVIRKWLTFLLIFGRWKDYMTKQTKQVFFFFPWILQKERSRICSSYCIPTG